MIPAQTPIRHYLSRLGFAAEIADVYLALRERSPQTMSQLARSAGVERTRLYRLMDELADSGLVELEVADKRSLFRAAPVANLRLLLARREQDLRALEGELVLLEQMFNDTRLSSPAARVQFYSGAEGVKQMLWNQTRATTPALGILYENMQIHTDSAFFERWVECCNDRGLQFRGLVGEAFKSSQARWYASHSNDRLQHWEARYVLPDILPITHSTVTYDDVVVHFNWRAGEVFGIEIYNAEIAATQRHLFELVWRQAQPMAI